MEENMKKRLTSLKLVETTSMNKCILLVTFGAVLCSCGRGKASEGSDSLIDSTLLMNGQMETIYAEPTEPPEESLEAVVAFAKADTIWLRDGMRVVHISGFGPQNEYIVMTDKSNRTVAVCSQASETESQTLSIYYRPDGGISKVKEIIGLDPYDILNDPDISFASMNKNKATYEYRFKYGKGGRLLEIRRIESERGKAGIEVIQASKGNLLEGGFRPVEDFWESDLRGGRMEIYCSEVPNTQSRQKNTIFRHWVDFSEVPDLATPPSISKAFFSEPKTIRF